MKKWVMAWRPAWLVFILLSIVCGWWAWDSNRYDKDLQADFDREVKNVSV